MYKQRDLFKSYSIIHILISIPLIVVALLSIINPKIVNLDGSDDFAIVLFFLINNILIFRERNIYNDFLKTFPINPRKEAMFLATRNVVKVTIAFLISVMIVFLIPYQSNFSLVDVLYIMFSFILFLVFAVFISTLNIYSSDKSIYFSDTFIYGIIYSIFCIYPYVYFEFSIKSGLVYSLFVIGLITAITWFNFKSEIKKIECLEVDHVIDK